MAIQLALCLVGSEDCQDKLLRKVSGKYSLRDWRKLHLHTVVDRNSKISAGTRSKIELATQ